MHGLRKFVYNAFLKDVVKTGWVAFGFFFSALLFSDVRNISSPNFIMAPMYLGCIGSCVIGFITTRNNDKAIRLIKNIASSRGQKASISWKNRQRLSLKTSMNIKTSIPYAIGVPGVFIASAIKEYAALRQAGFSIGTSGVMHLLVPYALIGLVVTGVALILEKPFSEVRLQALRKYFEFRRLDKSPDSSKDPGLPDGVVKSTVVAPTEQQASERSKSKKTTNVTFPEKMHHQSGTSSSRGQALGESTFRVHPPMRRVITNNPPPDVIGGLLKGPGRPGRW